MENSTNNKMSKQAQISAEMALNQDFNFTSFFAGISMQFQCELSK
jgi:hypothetical protein